METFDGAIPKGLLQKLGFRPEVELMETFLVAHISCDHLPQLGFRPEVELMETSVG